MEDMLTVVDTEFNHIDTPARRELPPSMVERLTRILESFDADDTRLTLEDVTIRTGLPRSTVHRILDQLVRLDWVDHAAFGYALGARARGLGRSGDRDRIREAAAPYLHELAARTGAVAHLEILDGTRTYCLDKIGAAATTVPTRVGGRAPAYATAGGKAILATLDPEHVDGMFPSRLVRCAPRTIDERAMLHRELNRIRKRHGIAFDREEGIAGIAAVGAPLRSATGPAASITLAGDIRTIQLDWVAPLVAECARRISYAAHGTAERRGTRGA